jgi:hypothetical protein
MCGPKRALTCLPFIDRKGDSPLTARCPPGGIFPLSLISGTSARPAMEASLSRYLSLATDGRGHMSGRVSSFKLRHYPCRKAALSCPTKNETRKTRECNYRQNSPMGGGIRTSAYRNHLNGGLDRQLVASGNTRLCGRVFVNLGGWESSIVVDRRLACQGRVPQAGAASGSLREAHLSLVNSRTAVCRACRPRKTSRPIRWCRSGSLVFEQHHTVARRAIIFSSVVLACGVHPSPTPIAMTISIIARTRPAQSRSKL